ncbi:hypothetical protein [Haliscomenobacter hydrossis]|uniref:Uncharacterized protein n=1 Tax=Haliscomenobacter hydrossis (strain ATCC 27775 / DSM 1100 / LMG 10767 / O) TaxID=760192 RepID=F4L5R1_HALH1|nr:hypothetical protein [Haliscomenobacter hydrossis]AEE51896.1 hypothetical protein Halhy_4048 [Haliscomenobacter hydrossis DSM 1100]
MNAKLNSFASARNSADDARGHLIALVLASDPKNIKLLADTFENIIQEPESFYDSLKNVILYMDHEALGNADFIYAIESLRSIMYILTIENTKRSVQTDLPSDGALN